MSKSFGACIIVLAILTFITAIIHSNSLVGLALAVGAGVLYAIGLIPYEPISAWMRYGSAILVCVLISILF